MTSLFSTPTDPRTGWSPWDYANEILSQLQRMNEDTGEDTDPPVARIRRGFVITLDGTGAGSTILLLPPGIAWELLTYAFQVTGTPSGYLAFYRDAEEGTGLVKVASLAQVADDSFNAQGHWIPEQSSLLIVVRSGPGNGVVAGNIAMKGVQNATPRHTAGGGEF